MKIHEQITEDLWTKRVFNCGGGHCLSGWIYQCYRSDYMSVRNKVSQYIEQHYGIESSFRSVEDWNDAADRKFKDVYSLVKELNI